MGDAVEPSPVSVATDRLADALVAVWEACDAEIREVQPGVLAGQNVAECLSVALGAAAARLAVAHPDEPPVPYRAITGEGSAAARILVKHRPGCWEAQHVIALTYDPDLL